MTVSGTSVSTWKRVVAPILDFFMVLVVGGQVLGWATGMRTPGGFELEGWAALLLLAVIVVYFYVGRRVAGGTLWDRFFGIARTHPTP